MIYSGRYLCLTISTPHNIPIWICSHPISMLSIYLTTWRQVCQSHFEFSPSLTKSFNLSGNHRSGQYIFASEYFDLHILVLSEITLPFAESAIWRIRDSNSKPKGKRAFFKIVAKQLFRSLDFSLQPPSDFPAVFLKLCHETEKMKTWVHISWVGQSTTPSPLQKIGSQGSAANNQTIKCRKLWKLRWATNNFHPLK